MDQAKVMEYVTHSWYEYKEGDKMQTSLGRGNRLQILGPEAAL